MRTIAPVLFAASLLCGTLAASAQTAPANIALPTVPTVKVVAIGSVVASPAAAKSGSIMPQEVSETVKLYLSGKIDSWYVRKDVRGVVFLMNVSSVEEAHELLEKLPLGVAGIMKFDLIPVGPLSPLNYLLAPGTALPPASAKP
jgi:hypothetical protein